MSEPYLAHQRSWKERYDNPLELTHENGVKIQPPKLKKVMPYQQALLHAVYRGNRKRPPETDSKLGDLIVMLSPGLRENLDNPYVWKKLNQRISLIKDQMRGLKVTLSYDPELIYQILLRTEGNMKNFGVWMSLEHLIKKLQLREELRKFGLIKDPTIPDLSDKEISSVDLRKWEMAFYYGDLQFDLLTDLVEVIQQKLLERYPNFFKFLNPGRKIAAMPVSLYISQNAMANGINYQSYLLRQLKPHVPVIMITKDGELASMFLLK